MSARKFRPNRKRGVGVVVKVAVAEQAEGALYC